MSEYKLHCAIIDHLRGERMVGKQVVRGTKPFAELFVTHIFQGRSEEDGFFLKRMGVYPGVADILCLWRGGIGFMEVKTEKGHLSAPQKKFKGICHWLGIKWALVRSVNEAHNTIKNWGLKEAHGAVREPDLRTEEQKHAAVNALWGTPKYLTPQDAAAGKINPDWAG